jgi:hypothetical protein
MPGSLASGPAELHGCVTDAPGRLEPWTAIPAGTGRPREPGHRRRDRVDVVVLFGRPGTLGRVGNQRGLRSAPAHSQSGNRGSTGVVI